MLLVRVCLTAKIADVGLSKVACGLQVFWTMQRDASPYFQPCQSWIALLHSSPLVILTMSHNVLLVLLDWGCLTATITDLGLIKIPRLAVLIDHVVRCAYNHACP